MPCSALLAHLLLGLLGRKKRVLHRYTASRSLGRDRKHREDVQRRDGRALEQGNRYTPRLRTSPC